MFAVAAIIWVFVLILFVRNSQKKEVTFFAKHKSTIVAALAALFLTVADIWLFIAYIPTHFKKLLYQPKNYLAILQLLILFISRLQQQWLKKIPQNKVNPL